jgi:hypothetical protein
VLPSKTFPGPGEGGTSEALNCLRVLGRVIVVIYESEDKEWANEVLWSRQKRPADLPTSPDTDVDRLGEEMAETQFTIADDSDDEETGDLVDEGARAFKASVGRPRKTSTSTSTPESPPTNDDGTIHDPLANPGPQEEDQGSEAEDDDDLLPSLAERLFSCTVDLLFCVGFSVPDSARGEDVLITDKINVSLSRTCSRKN